LVFMVLSRLTSTTCGVANSCGGKHHMIAINDILKTPPFANKALPDLFPVWARRTVFSTFYRWKYRHDSR
jgi:hypothetical protein